MATPFSRRTLLVAAAGGAVVAACSDRAAGQLVGPLTAAVGKREDRRRRPNAAVREATLVAASATIDLGGRAASTWAYGNALPGPLLRLRAGEVLRARLDNPAARPDQHPLARDRAAQRHGRRSWRHPAAGRPGRLLHLRVHRPRPGHLLSSTRTLACSWTAACTARWWSTTRPTRAATTGSWSSCWTTGPTASAAPPPRSSATCSAAAWRG